ncbi:MAG: hypothetical protein EOO92_15095 [Pedobacter sp.]|nr:MAG: hypothetical protein EOO92_15095 [Pedobacter sp.]
MNKRTILSILAFSLIFTLGCKKTFPELTPPDEEKLIKDYVAINHPNAIRDESGMYYQVITPGDGAANDITSSVNLNYTAKILNGNQFDAGSNKSFVVQNVFRAWQIALPKIKPGGKIIIFVPSLLAYGKFTPKPEIPEYATLIFELELIGYLK